MKSKNKSQLKVPFKLNSVAASKESASKGYWESTAKQIKKPEFVEAINDFIKAAKSVNKNKSNMKNKYPWFQGGVDKELVREIVAAQEDNPATKKTKVKKKSKPKKAKMYLVCCLSETDGEPHFTYLDAYSIRKLKLHKDPDCTIIDGKIITASELK